MGVKRAQVHLLTPFAKVSGSRIIYPLDKANRMRSSQAGRKYRITI
jgi:hypothetical protein